MLNLSDFDGIELSGLIKKGEISPVEAVEAAVGNIEKLNPKLNAVIFKDYDRALKTASLMESDILRGRKSVSPLFGTPFLVKNLIAECMDSPFSEGSRFVDGYISDIDTEIVARYREAGLIILGRTNSSEFGVVPTTEPDFYGPTLNPWNTGFSPGGSSGGSAAAVASGMVPTAHGNDGGGSLRIPASCCGLFGLKPSRARNPAGPLFGDLAGGIVCEHALTRTVRDSAALLDITAGPDTGAAYYAPEFHGKYLSEVGKDPGKLRIGFITEIPEGWNIQRDLHPDCRAAVNEAAAVCQSIGHYVEEVPSGQLAFPDIPEMFIKVFSAFVGFTVAYWERKLRKKIREEELEPATWDLYKASLAITSSDYLVAWEMLQLFSRKIAAWHNSGHWDLLLTPVMRIPPIEIGSFKSGTDDPDKWINNALSFVVFTRTQNITGQPAMSVPLSLNGRGLPIGVQFAGKTGSENVLFRLAAQLEMAKPWINNRPSEFC